jgi:hypothetical protein
MGKKIERQIRYNLKTDTGEQENMRYRYTFLIINEPREIERIKERIWQEMFPIAYLNKIDEGQIKNSRGLHYELFSFSTDKGKIENPQKIYDVKYPKFGKDRNLSERMTDGLYLLLNE